MPSHPGYPKKIKDLAIISLEKTGKEGNYWRGQKGGVGGVIEMGGNRETSAVWVSLTEPGKRFSVGVQGTKPKLSRRKGKS